MSTLPGDWSEVVDPSSGRTYFINFTTKQTQWDRPTANHSAPPPSPPASTSLPVGWEERYDEGSGRHFYINHNTRTTTWERPTNGVAQRGEEEREAKRRLKRSESKSKEWGAGTKR